MVNKRSEVIIAATPLIPTLVCLRRLNLPVLITLLLKQKNFVTGPKFLVTGLSLDTKKTLVIELTGYILVAGVGFEPTTFRL